MVLGALLTLVLAASTRADQYSVAYEGNDFPENEGWERVFGDENGPQQGGSNRSLEDGWLVLDSTRHHLIYDTYFWRQQLNPDPGELFICEWRINVIQNIGVLPDEGLAIARDGRGSLGFQIGYDYLRISTEDFIIPIAAGAPHTFRVESSDMLNYVLLIDNTLVHTGAWDLNSLNESYVAFGDGRMGGGVTSLAEWDYVRFGVVPEPETATLVGLGSIWFVLRRKRP